MALPVGGSRVGRSAGSTSNGLPPRGSAPPAALRGGRAVDVSPGPGLVELGGHPAGPRAVGFGVQLRAPLGDLSGGDRVDPRERLIGEVCAGAKQPDRYQPPPGVRLSVVIPVGGIVPPLLGRGLLLFEPHRVLAFGEHPPLIRVIDGLSNAEIGQQLYISETTVKTHVTHILQKLGLHDRVQAIVLAHQTGPFQTDTT